MVDNRLRRIIVADDEPDALMHVEGLLTGKRGILALLKTIYYDFQESKDSTGEVLATALIQLLQEKNYRITHDEVAIEALRAFLNLPIALIHALSDAEVVTYPTGSLVLKKEYADPDEPNALRVNSNVALVISDLVMEDPKAGVSLLAALYTMYQESSLPLPAMILNTGSVSPRTAAAARRQDLYPGLPETVYIHSKEGADVLMFLNYLFHALRLSSQWNQENGRTYEDSNNGLDEKKE